MTYKLLHVIMEIRLLYKKVLIYGDKNYNKLNML